MSSKHKGHQKSPKNEQTQTQVQNEQESEFEQGQKSQEGVVTVDTVANAIPKKAKKTLTEEEKTAKNEQLAKGRAEKEAFKEKLLNHFESFKGQIEDFDSYIKGIHKYLSVSSLKVRGPNSVGPLLGSLRKYLPAFFEANPDAELVHSEFVKEFFVNYLAKGDVNEGFGIYSRDGKDLNKQFSDALWYIRFKPLSDTEIYWVGPKVDTNKKAIVDINGHRIYILYGKGPIPPENFPGTKVVSEKKGDADK